MFTFLQKLQLIALSCIAIATTAATMIVLSL